MNPHNEALHAVYQRAKWKIQTKKCTYVCDTLNSLQHDFFLNTVIDTALNEFRLLFKHLGLTTFRTTLYWPSGDTASRMAALDTMISLCKKNYF